MTGYNELTLKNLNLLKSNVPITEEMLNVIKTVGHWNGDVEYRREEELKVLYLKIEEVSHDDKHYYIGNINDIMAYKSKEKELYMIQHFDSLTNLYNEVSFEELTKNFLEQRINQKLKHAVIMINIDNFRLINEAKGFDFGNEVLIKIARELESQVKESDLLARLGNDEFVILKTNVKNDEELYNYVLDLFKHLNKNHEVSKEELFTNLRFGVSLYPSDATDYSMLLKNATSALNSVKDGSGSNFAFYNKDMNDKSIYKYELKNGLKNAIDAEELILYYQPQIDIASNKIIGMEALIRWKTSNEIIPPNIFIPIAEGAEEEAHVNFLRENGCPQAQGFFFSKPVPEDDIIRFIESNLNS